MNDVPLLLSFHILCNTVLYITKNTECAIFKLAQYRENHGLNCCCCSYSSAPACVCHRGECARDGELIITHYRQKTTSIGLDRPDMTVFSCPQPTSPISTDRSSVAHSHHHWYIDCPRLPHTTSHARPPHATDQSMTANGGAPCPCESLLDSTSARIDN